MCAWINICCNTFFIEKYINMDIYVFPLTCFFISHFDHLVGFGMVHISGELGWFMGVHLYPQTFWHNTHIYTQVHAIKTSWTFVISMSFELSCWFVWMCDWLCWFVNCHLLPPSHNAVADPGFFVIGVPMWQAKLKPPYTLIQLGIRLSKVLVQIVLLALDR